ncbi:MAG: zinc ABC transporter substrate-binding protein [Lachnospiraceae bacterium]|nr:zinc ABC transporter substrate-binding protein [Lachnospiraceae bacterium]
MKKNILILIAAIFMAGCLLACGSTAASEITGTSDTAGTTDAVSGEDKIQIVTTIFPEYDWVKNILGSNPAGAEVTMLLDNGVDLHSYQPTADDILKMSTCDMFIYVGGESDEWVEDALKEAVNKDMVVVNLLDVLGDSVKEEEIVEGMQGEDEHEHEHEHEDGNEADDHEHKDTDAEDEHEDGDADDGHEHEHEEGEAEYDEHVWLSLRNAVSLTEHISEELQRIDEKNADIYKKNTVDYIAKLEDLDKQYTDTVADAPVKTLLFGDRFPFRYLTDDYGLSYYAAFVGCSAETEASFETIMFLAGKVDELSLHAVMTIEGADHRIAETIIQNTKSRDQQILTMDSMQSTTLKDVEGGTSYLSVMESNLSVLTEALK